VVSGRGDDYLVKTPGCEDFCADRVWPRSGL